MIEPGLQKIFYFFEILVSILIGGVLFPSHGIWTSVLAGSIVLIVSIIINVILFGKELDAEPVVIIGFVSLVLMFFGTYYLFGTIFAIASVVIILFVILLLVLIVKGYSFKH